MALTTDIAGEFSDSYVTIAEANQYFASHWSTAKESAWSSLSVAQRERVLKFAANIIDTLRIHDVDYGSGPLPPALRADGALSYSVHRLDMVQRLGFPRNVDVDSTGTAYIPTEVKDAQCEQAVFLLTADETAMSNYLSGIAEEAVSAGPVRVYTRYADGASASMIAPMTMELLRPFVRPTRRMKRG